MGLGNGLGVAFNSSGYSSTSINRNPAPYPFRFAAKRRFKLISTPYLMLPSDPSFLTTPDMNLNGVHTQRAVCPVSPYRVAAALSGCGVAVAIVASIS